MWDIGFTGITGSTFLQTQFKANRKSLRASQVLAVFQAGEGADLNGHPARS
jgi:hypothetical protein